jgi:hypothetical protein
MRSKDGRNGVAYIPRSESVQNRQRHKRLQGRLPGSLPVTGKPATRSLRRRFSLTERLSRLPLRKSVDQLACTHS